MKGFFQSDVVLKRNAISIVTAKDFFPLNTALMSLIITAVASHLYC